MSGCTDVEIAYTTSYQKLYCPDSDKFYGDHILKSMLIQEISFIPIERWYFEIVSTHFQFSQSEKKLAVLGLNVILISVKKTKNKKLNPKTADFFWIDWNRSM